MKNKNSQNPLTKKDLIEFAEETLLPAVEHIVDEKISKVDEKVGKLDERVGKLEEKMNGMKLDLMDFIDDKIADLRGDISFCFAKKIAGFFVW